MERINDLWIAVDLGKTGTTVPVERSIIAQHEAVAYHPNCGRRDLHGVK